MDVVSVTDGKHLGRVCDIVFSFPEGRVCGFNVTGSKGFKLTRPDFFIPLSAVVRIGEDVVLVKDGKGKNCPPPPPPGRGMGCPPGIGGGQRRDMSDYE